MFPLIPIIAIGLAGLFFSGCEDSPPEPHPQRPSEPEPSTTPPPRSTTRDVNLLQEIHGDNQIRDAYIQCQREASHNAGDDPEDSSGTDRSRQRHFVECFSRTYEHAGDHNPLHAVFALGTPNQLDAFVIDTERDGHITQTGIGTYQRNDLSFIQDRRGAIWRSTPLSSTAQIGATCTRAPNGILTNCNSSRDSFADTPSFSWYQPGFQSARDVFLQSVGSNGPSSADATISTGNDWMILTPRGGAAGQMFFGDTVINTPLRLENPFQIPPLVGVIQHSDLVDWIRLHYPNYTDQMDPHQGFVHIETPVEMAHAFNQSSRPVFNRPNALSGLTTLSVYRGDNEVTLKLKDEVVIGGFNNATLAIVLASNQPEAAAVVKAPDGTYHLYTLDGEYRSTDTEPEPDLASDEREGMDGYHLAYLIRSGGHGEPQNSRVVRVSESENPPDLNRQQQELLVRQVVHVAFQRTLDWIRSQPRGRGVNDPFRYIRALVADMQNRFWITLTPEQQHQLFVLMELRNVTSNPSSRDFFTHLTTRVPAQE